MIRKDCYPTVGHRRRLSAQRGQMKLVSEFALPAVTGSTNCLRRVDEFRDKQVEAQRVKMIDEGVEVDVAF